MSRMISAEGLKYLERREGRRTEAYPDTKGVWTIGVGHTLGVKKGDVATEEQIDKWLLADSGWAMSAINHYVTVPLLQYQFDALVSLVFNIGGGEFRDSTLLKRLNEGNFESAANHFMDWVYSGGKRVLVGRRTLDKDLFKEGMYA